jgi:hypothetical protein
LTEVVNTTFHRVRDFHKEVFCESPGALKV